ncbi:hypothetical protein CL619_00345 [archaeon]|nr:hypothetical protein [archaeon]
MYFLNEKFEYTVNHSDDIKIDKDMNDDIITEKKDYPFSEIDESIFDRDSDGYYSDVDCNDFNSSINPGETEICEDGIDQDCNGGDLVCSFDLDGDGFFDNMDCNDNDDSIYPWAPEICEDGIDQNCNGVDMYCNYSIRADLVAHNPSTWATVTNGSAYVFNDIVLNSPTTLNINLNCGIWNVDIGNAVGNSINMCRLIGNTFWGLSVQETLTFNLSEWDIATFSGNVELWNSYTTTQFLQSVYDTGFGNTTVYYQVDMGNYTANPLGYPAHIAESNESNNWEFINITVDGSQVSFFDAECSEDFNCVGNMTCGSGYACVEN